ncbi:MAG: MaoC family dehydratase [Pseudomonadota bacterium]|nr:MaoC family dehydratase [Pseudomonadota bacterium]
MLKERLTGPYRHPRQMLGTQEYDGHLSIHDDEMADKLGFAGAPIEGPTHFSQFVHLLEEALGPAVFERGCISAHYQNMVFEGDEVRAFVEPAEREGVLRIGAEKKDGTPVLTGTASLGPEYGETELDRRRAKLRPSEQLVLLSDLAVGQKGAGNPESARMAFDQHMGALYPFSLAQKLERITEPHPWYTAEGAKDSPWGRPIIPWEMISVLTQYTSDQAKFRARGPAVGLFAAQEIKLLKGPLFVDHPYLLEREILALSESRRTESNWILTRVYDGEDRSLVAEVILNSATLKDSYANYAADAAALGKVL